ncbi:hypothetical protein [Brucella pituitosa]|uniref:hypothetical protein n=1 Tax=Brucella pituitosa TaxID=571256 RepID=UPI0009A1D05E|nr:hypothetical protein [Brucella pituitosa]
MIEMMKEYVLKFGITDAIFYLMGLIGVVYNLSNIPGIVCIIIVSIGYTIFKLVFVDDNEDS